MSTSPYTPCQNIALFTKKVKKDQMAIRIARRIILESVNNQITFNIMDLEDPKEM